MWQFLWFSRSNSLGVIWLSVQEHGTQLQGCFKIAIESLVDFGKLNITPRKSLEQSRSDSWSLPGLE